MSVVVFTNTMEIRENVLIEESHQGLLVNPTLVRETGDISSIGEICIEVFRGCHAQCLLSERSGS